MVGYRIWEGAGIDHLEMWENEESNNTMYYDEEEKVVVEV